MMLQTTHAIALTAALTWIMILTASMMRNRGLDRSLGNRDTPPEPAPAAGRADRAAKNMLENLVLFAVVLLAAFASGAHPDRVRLGANLFFAARVVYFPIYVAGIKYVRTLCWAIAVVGLILIASAAF